MIEKLTEKQTQQLVDFKSDCLKIGLSTDRIKIGTHNKNIEYIYKYYLGLPMPIIWYVDSPLMLNLLLNFVFKELQKHISLYEPPVKSPSFPFGP